MPVLIVIEKKKYVTRNQRGLSAYQNVKLHFFGSQGSPALSEVGKLIPLIHY